MINCEITCCFEIITLLLKLSISAKLNVLIYEIHVNMWRWIVTLWDVKLWTWDLIVNKYVVNTWCDNTCAASYELYNNPTSVYLEKSVYAQC